LPRRRIASVWTFPMNPVPMTAAFNLCIRL
jgi:hypothetical protein